MVKKIKRRKRKLKQKVKITLLLLLFLIISSIIITVLLNDRTKTLPLIEKVPARTTEEIITSILTYELEEGIDENFLKWINEKYQTKTLEELENRGLFLNFSSALLNNSSRIPLSSDARRRISLL